MRKYNRKGEETWTYRTFKEECKKEVINYSLMAAVGGLLIGYILARKK